MAERAEPVLARAARGWPLLPVLRRMAAMPLKDPFAFTGLLDLRAVRAGRAVRRPAGAASIRWRSCSPRPASSRPTWRPAPSFRSARPISAATSMPSSCYGTRSALAVGLSAAVIVATVGTDRRPGGGLFRRRGRRGADAHRRHGAQPALPALRHRADRLPRRQHLEHRARRRRCCCGPTRRA